MSYTTLNAGGPTWSSGICGLKNQRLRQSFRAETEGSLTTWWNLCRAAYYLEVFPHLLEMKGENYNGWLGAMKLLTSLETKLTLVSVCLSHCSRKNLPRLPSTKSNGTAKQNWEVWSKYKLSLEA